MENYLSKEEKDKRINKSISKVLTDVKVAIMGSTKRGKTTTLASITNVAKRIINISKGDDGRTKVTVEYKVVAITDNNDIFIDDIDIYYQNIMGSVDGDVEKYNAQIDNFKVLKSVLNLDKISDEQNVKVYIDEKIKDLKNKPVSDDVLKKLICSETIDNFIRKITLRVPAHFKLAEFITEQNIDLRIRDTRGLLDVMLDGDVKSQTSKSLTDLGLDYLDGVVFFGSDEYPNLIAELYKDTMKSVMESIPVFTVHNKTDLMYELFTMNGQKATYKNVEEMIEIIQDKKHPLFTPITLASKSNSTFKLFESLGIGSFSNGSFNFKDSCFNIENTQFLLPTCSSLIKSGSERFEEEAFEFYQFAAVASFIKMVGMISELKYGMSNILYHNSSKNILRETNEELISELINDFNSYDNSYIGDGATRFIKPQLKYLSCYDISKNISEPNLRIGPRGGITTMNNGKLRYATTAVIAVGARRWINHLIYKITEDKIILVDDNGNPIFGKGINNSNLYRKALLNKLYKQFTDTEATIQSYLLVNRYSAVNGINNTCKPNNSIDDVITEIINDFMKLSL